MLELTQANIFLAIFAVGALFSLLSFVVGEVFDGVEELLDGVFDIFDFDADGGHPGLFRALVVCVTGFGAGGWAASIYGSGALASTAIGTVTGLISGGLTLAVLIFITKQQATSTIASGSIKGAVGTLTLAIPEGGTGQAVLSVAGARLTRSARAADGRAIAFNARVRVVEVEGDDVVVEAVTPTA